MSSYDRRAVARRRAWGRGPMILRFEPLEGRQLLSTVGPKADLLATQFNTVHAANWGDQIHAIGTIANRGTATTSTTVEVDIYASSTPTLNATGAVTKLLGSVMVPAGLTPGATSNFNQLVTLPPSSTLSTGSATSTIYITLLVDPHNSAKEANLADKAGRGLGLDTSPLVVSQVMPANLIGSSFSVAPIATTSPGVISWGDTFDVTEQIKNNGQGAAPPTRARIVLTPLGATQGAYSDVTIGTINVPAIPAFQSTNVVQRVTLPPVEPLTLGNASQFTISVVQDGDFVTQPIYPRLAGQGPGLDQGPIGISPGPMAGTPQGATPDLAPSTVVVSQTTLYWGQQFQVGAVIQNVSNVDAGPFTVRFVATGASGDVSHGIFLGDVQVSGLAANGSTGVLTAVQLPAKLPFGTTIASPAYAKIYAITDPEDVVNESLRSNNMASSAPVLLQVVGTDGTTTTVPTYPQNIYTNPTLALQAAKQVAKAQKAKLGTPKPAASTKKHKVDFLASISETIIKQITGIPKGVNSLLKDIGGGGNSGNTNTANTNTATANTATANNVSTGTTSSGAGGFGATGV
jgi:hypothetical protein